MASVGSVQGGGSAAASLLAAADDNTAVVATLLKKTTEADKNLVNTLLPPTGATSGGRLDIRA